MLIIFLSILRLKIFNTVSAPSHLLLEEIEPDRFIHFLYNVEDGIVYTYLENNFKNFLNNKT